MSPTTNNYYILVSLILLITKIIPSSFSLSFNLSTISPDDQAINITLHQDMPKPKGRQFGGQLTGGLSNGFNQIDMATYNEPLHLWDQSSRHLAGFTTHFSFLTNSKRGDHYGEGLAFFLAPNDGWIVNPWYVGQLNLSEHSFVAVNFDMYMNSSDPMPKPHVCIKINSLESVNKTIWKNNFTQGMRNYARISYNAAFMMLRVHVTGLSGNGKQWRDSLSYTVDLRNILPEYVTFGFSAAGASLESFNVKSWEFNSSSLERSVPSKDITPIPAPVPGPEPKINTGLIGFGLSVGLSVAVTFGVALASYCLWWRKKYTKGSRYDENEDLVDPEMEKEFEKGSGAKKFLYRELVLATMDFAEKEKLGEGGFGGVYRGFLKENKSYIAVKRVSRGSRQGLKEYASEVTIISRLRHRNLVQLIGWCHQRGELLLVYEFMPNGSLDSHLFKSKSILTWEVRYKIAQGLASALLYLHEGWERCVVHRDIKSSNIMLDSNFNAKLGDFGLARLVDHEKGSQTTVLAGTMGYMAPECASTGRASKETDVYSFGIVLLEICCGRRPFDRRNQEDNQVVLVEWVWSLYGKGKLLEAADPNLSTDFDERGMEQVMVVGLWCVHPDTNCRPSIRQAIQALNFEVTLPILPPELPVPMYFGPTTSMELNNTDTHPGRGSDFNYNSNCSSSSSVTAR